MPPEFCPGRRSWLAPVMFALGQTIGPVRPVDGRVGDLLLEVQPDTLVLAAVVAAAGYGALLVDAAAERTAVQVATVPIGALVDQVRLPQVPADDPLAYVLL